MARPVGIELLDAEPVPMGVVDSVQTTICNRKGPFGLRVEAVLALLASQSLIGGKCLPGDFLNRRRRVGDRRVDAQAIAA